MSTGDLKTKIFSCIEVTWKIDDFLNKPAVVGSGLLSESFPFAKVDWQLELFPNSCSEDEDEGYINLYLKRLNSPIPVHDFLIKCCFKSRHGEEYQIRCYSFDIRKTSSEMCYCERTELMELKDSLLPNGTLTVCCQIRMKSPNESLECHSFQQVGTEGSSKEQNDAFTQTETLDFNSRTEVLPETSSKVFLDFYKESAGNLSTEKYFCLEVTWKIDERNLNKPTYANFAILSKSFSFANADWQLEMLQNGNRFHDWNDFILVYLTRLNSSIPYDTLFIKSFLFSWLREDYKRFSGSFLCYSQNPSYKIYYLPRSYLMDNKWRFLQCGTLTFRCEIRTKSFSRSESAESCFDQQQMGAEVRPVTSTTLHKLQSDYKKFLESKEEADVCLKVSDKEFRAHKCILMARSPVFFAMFKHDTEEKASGEVVIDDLDPESFPDFLQHMYSGSVDNLSEENVFNLYTAADKYDMTDLKSECKSYMERTLSVGTFCDVVILALRYKEDELLKLAVDFFSKNLTKIILTVKWQKFLIAYGTAANELLIKALVPADEK